MPRDKLVGQMRDEPAPTTSYDICVSAKVSEHGHEYHESVKVGHIDRRVFLQGLSSGSYLPSLASCSDSVDHKCLGILGFGPQNVEP